MTRLLARAIVILVDGVALVFIVAFVTVLWLGESIHRAWRFIELHGVYGGDRVLRDREEWKQR